MGDVIERAATDRRTSSRAIGRRFDFIFIFEDY
jgi:hypothetical protein